MSTGILLCVLAAAFMHALWNALIKVGDSKVGGMVVLSLGEIPIGLAIAATRPMPAAEVWSWVIAAGCCHFFYKLFLTYAYDRGDLSRVYPIARGAAPMVVAIVGALLLADEVTGWEYAGIFLLGGGIALMARGVFAEGEERRMLPFALGSALATASYTMIDGMGARISGDAIAYVAWVFVADGLLFTTGMLALRGTVVVPRGLRPWSLGLIAAAASYGAYAISIWAMTKAPIALVAALRETSILFAVLIGWLAFGERMTRGKAIAALTIVAGVIATRL